MTIDWAFLKGINGEEMLMSDNFIAFSFDEAEKSKRFYSGLTDDDISDHVENIKAKAQQVTLMLDELLKTSQEDIQPKHVEPTDATP